LDKEDRKAVGRRKRFPEKQYMASVPDLFVTGPSSIATQLPEATHHAQEKCGNQVLANCIMPLCSPWDGSTQQKYEKMENRSSSGSTALADAEPK